MSIKGERKRERERERNLDTDFSYTEFAGQSGNAPLLRVELVEAANLFLWVERRRKNEGFQISLRNLSSKLIQTEEF